MYQPKLPPCHIRALYLLKNRDGKPMTFHVRKAVEQYLEIHADDSTHSNSRPLEPHQARVVHRSSSGLCTPRPPWFSTCV